MILRRTVLAAAVGGFALTGLGLAGTAEAQSWRQRYPELVFAVVPAENASGVTERYGPFAEYLSKELGTKVTLRIANDYAAVIEGQKAGNIHIAEYGPSSYARARMTDVATEPFATSINEDGSIGYYSVFYVKKDAPYQKVEDLRGKNLGLVDPNSTSGNNVPRFALSKMNIVPDQFFGRVVYTGSHENAVIALQQGTVDVAANWWNSETDSNLTRMANKNMVKLEDFRILFRSDLIPGSPVAYLASLPEDLKAAIRQAYMDAPTKAKAEFDRLFDGKSKGFQAVRHEDYVPVIELNRFVDQLRRQRG